MSTEPITITPDFVWPKPDADGNRTLANGAVIGPGATIERYAVIGPDVVIERGAVIGPYTVIGPGVVIKRGAVIGQDAFIEQGAVIERGAVIRRNASIGQGAVIGPYASIEQCAVIGHDARVGPNARWVACVGYADGYYKDLCAVGDVAYIGAGCRWFTLGEALRHWENHPEDRRATMALMEGAKALAALNNLKWE